jgi:hypothetical protein
MRAASHGKSGRDGLDPEIVIQASELPLVKTLPSPSGTLLGDSTMILAGDIGGTKTVIANYEESGRNLRQVRAATYHCRGLSVPRGQPGLLPEGQPAAALIGAAYAALHL